jgi:hypothetical protein
MVVVASTTASLARQSPTGVTDVNKKVTPAPASFRASETSGKDEDVPK